MVKAMKSRAVRTAFLQAGCIERPGKGDHVKWTCPCGKHTAIVTYLGDVSPGLIRQAIARMQCLPKGWLQ